MIKNYYTYPQEDNMEPGSIVFLLHGLGSNGQDLISLAPLWAAALPHTLFISPDAPFICDMVPPGYGNAYQWFSLQDRAPDVMKAGADTALPILQDFISSVTEPYNAGPDKIVLTGFSQGTMMALHTALHAKESFAGVLGYSGALLGGDALKKPDRTFPVCLVHGEADDVVPVAACHHARQALEEAGFTVTGHTTANLAHSIDQDGINAGQAFLQNALRS